MIFIASVFTVTGMLEIMTMSAIANQDVKRLQKLGKVSQYHFVSSRFKGAAVLAVASLRCVFYTALFLSTFTKLFTVGSYTWEWRGSHNDAYPVSPLLYSINTVTQLNQ